MSDGIRKPDAESERSAQQQDDLDDVDFKKLLDHEYDGIREYDNPLPGWWTGIFIASILFSVGYLVYYHMGGPGLSEAEEYAQEIAEWKAKGGGAMAGVSEEELAKLQADPAVLTETKAVFLEKCLPCHKADGGGSVGPNLTDSFQIHGKTRADLYSVIYNGVPAKGMIAWGKILQPDQIKNLAAFVASLRGTNVSGGKAPQGEKVEAFK